MIALFAALTLAAAPVLYVHPQRLLSARFPGKPVETDQETPSAVGVIRSKGASLTNERGVYSVTAIVYPVGGTLNVEAVLNGARDQTLKNNNARMVSEKQIRVDGIPGRELRFESAAHVHGVTRLFARAGPPVLIAITATQKEPDAELEKFLESLHFGKSVETK
jgi:hypothetical protein